MVSDGLISWVVDFPEIQNGFRRLGVVFLLRCGSYQVSFDRIGMLFINLQDKKQGKNFGDFLLVQGNFLPAPRVRFKNGNP